MDNESFNELRASVKEGGEIVSKSQKRRIALQKEGQRVSNDRLQELIDMHLCYNDIMEGSNEVLKSEYADLLSSLEELQLLRERRKAQIVIVENMIKISGEMAEENRLLLEDGERMALILSDGEGKEDQICCVDFFHARDAAYKHAELMESIEKEV